MAKNLSKITIGGREIEVENDEWPIEKFHLDLANPRYERIPESEREDEDKMEEIERHLGKNKTFIHQKIWAFEKTRDYWKYNPKDKDVLRFSYFEEFYKQRGPLNYDEKNDPEQARTLLNFVFQGIKDKRFNVEGAKDMRHLPKILADKEAKEAFLGGTEHR